MLKIDILKSENALYSYFMRKFFLIACCGWASMYACTGVKLVAKDGSVVHGRTWDGMAELDAALVVVPRAIPFAGTTHLGEGLRYTSKYAAMGLIAHNQPAILDGINEKGLCAAAFSFNGYAHYMPLDEHTVSLALSPAECVHWILTQHATVDEVRAALSSVIIAKTAVKGWGNQTPAFHYIVYDRNGKSLVIQPIDGKLVVYDNALGLLTGGPSFSWHMTQLRQTVFSSVENIKPFKLNRFSILPHDAQLSSLPGGASSSARFIRAGLLQSGLHGNTSEEAALRAFHILNQFDLLPQTGKEYTQLCCVRDPQTLKFYFKTYADPSIRVIDLNQFDLDDPEIKRLSIAETNLPQAAADISAELN